MASQVREAEESFFLLSPVTLRHTCLTSLQRPLTSQTDSDLIIAISRKGSTVKQLAKYKPNVPIMAFVPTPQIGRRLVMHRGVYPIVMESTAADDEHERVVEAMRTAKVRRGLSLEELSPSPKKKSLTQFSRSRLRKSGGSCPTTGSLSSTLSCGIWRASLRRPRQTVSKFSPCEEQNTQF